MMPAQAAAKTGIPDFSGLVETYSTAVVNISAKHVVKETAARRGNANQVPMNPDDSLYQFFKRFYGNVPGFGGGDGGPGPGAGRPSEGLGSGFIVSSNGYITFSPTRTSSMAPTSSPSS